MPANIENFEFGTKWNDFSSDIYEGYLPNMSDYHMHGYYEISLILSGNVKVLLPEKVQCGEQSRLLLTRPMTSHLVICEPGILYKRVNLLFSNEYLVDYIPEWKQLLRVFGKNGRILMLTDEETQAFFSLAENIRQENNPVRRRLLLLFFLSKASDLLEQIGQEPIEELPTYITEALNYLQEHYAKKIVTADLAWQLGVGRTTLMTDFKYYTGSTLNTYLTRLRLRQVIVCLRNGQTEQSAAENCGFGDACNLIRAFRRYFGTTPRRYLRAQQGNDSQNNKTFFIDS